MSRTFKNSFRPTVDKLGETVSCSLKRHFYGAFREVAGYLDRLAELDATGERFVYAHVDTIVEHCKRYQGEGYRRRWIAYVLSEMRAQQIISHPVIRMRDGYERRGFIVAPHDALAIRNGSRCSLARRQPCLGIPYRGEGQWVRDTHHGHFVWSGRIIRTPCNAHSSAYLSAHLNAHAGARLGAHENQNQCTPECIHEAGQDAGKSAVDGNKTQICAGFAPLSPGKPVQTAQTGPPGREPIWESSSQDSEGREQIKPERQDPGGEENPNALTDQNRKTSSQEVSIRTLETIGQHFAELSWATLSDAELDTDTKQGQQYLHWNKLEKCAEEAIKLKKDLPFGGRATCAQLMADSAKLLRQKHGLDAPQSWFAVVKELRRTPGPVRTGGMKQQPEPVYDLPTALNADDSRIHNRITSMWREATGISIFDPMPEHLWVWIEKNAAGELNKPEALARLERPDCPEELRAPILTALAAGKL